MTRSAVTDSVKLYLDGQPDFAFQMIPVELTGMPWIGVGNNPCDSSLNRRFFPGEIDELRFYDRILDAGEIAELSGITVGAPVSPAPIPILSVFPSPMRGATTLSLVLPSAGDASVRVYDLRGALVRTVASGPLPAGARTIRWSGDDGSGLPVPAGVYLIRLESGGTAAARKVVVLE